MTIIQQPDSLSFSGNLKKFIISTNVTTPFSLMMGQTTILTNFYNPGVNGQIEIDLREIIERQLSIILPTDGDAVTDQTTGVADFTANIGVEPVEFRVIKGGVYDLDVSAATFCNEHFLTWQAQEKKILQDQPEWLTLYATEEWEVKCKAYYLNNSEVASETVTLATIPEDHLQTLDVSWQAICDAITATQPIAWDIWFEDQSGRLSYIQRYQLRNAGAEENVFVWTNTLGGVDSASFTGFAEDDQKLEHQIAELYSEDLDEYRIEKKTEIKQSTGFLTAREGIWLRDFFYSKRRYKIELDGSVRSIVLVDSKVVNSTADDLKEYEFTFRYSCDNSLLNLDRVVTDLPAPEGLSDFFLTELLAGLPVADYDGNLNIAVQSPFASGWMKLSLDQLFNQALPEFIDNITIRFIDGKLCTDVGAVIMGLKPKHGFESSGTSLLAFNSQTRIFSITANGFSSFPVWNMGEPLYKETESALIDNVEGIWYIYYKDTLLNTNVLVASQTKWDRNVDIPIAFVVWESGAGTLVDNRYKYTEVNHELLTRYANMPHPALDIYLDTTNFNGFLSDQETTVQKALDKYDDHKHWKLYTPDYLDGFVYTSIVNGVPTLNILGDIIQNGSAYETHAEQVYTKDDLIILRDGALSALAEGQYAGFKAKLYDGTNDGSLVFDAYGIARVGDVGFEQPIATRIETPTNDHFAYWEAANSRLNFKLLDTSFVSENTNLYFTTARAKAAIYADLHANYLPYFNGAILTDSGAYWEETEYGASPSVPGRLLELSSSDNFHLRIGEGSVNPLHTYDIGRVSATGHLTFYGNQTGYVGYVFDGVDGQLLHIDNLMATFCGGITAVFAAASTDTDKFIVSDGGVLKSRTGTQVRLDIEAQPLDADLTAIAALSGTTGLLRKTAADTWELDTTAYLSSLAHNLTGDVSGAYGSNTVDKIKNKSIASLTAGFFKYDGSGFVFDSNTYLTSLAHNLAGDVSGAYGSNTVDKIKNKSIATLTAGFLKYNGSGFVFDSSTYQPIGTNIHANYLPYWNGTELTDSGVYWEETEYGLSTLLPGRLLELSTSDSYQLRVGSGLVNPLHTYDIGRSSATGHLTFYGNQSGYVGYVFDGINGQSLHLDNVMATFAGGLTATFAAATTSTDKYLVSDSGVVKYRTASQLLSDIGLTTTGALYGTGTSFSGVALGAGQVMRRNLNNTAYEAYTPIPGGSIPSGSVSGQLLWWDNDNTAWKVTNTSYLKYIDADGKLVFGSVLIGTGINVQHFIDYGSSGARLYGLSLTRGAYQKANYPTVNLLKRPDIYGYESTVYGNRLAIGRNGYNTDIIIGDGSGVLDDNGTGLANAYIQFPAYGAGLALFSSTGLISSLATSVNGTRFLREDGSWQAVSAGSMVYPGAGISISTGSGWGVSITNNSTNWDKAYNERNNWDGGTGNWFNAATGRSSLGLYAEWTGTLTAYNVLVAAGTINANTIYFIQE